LRDTPRGAGVTRPRRQTLNLPPALGWPTRLKAILKLAIGGDGYPLVKWPFGDVIHPCDEDYIMTPVLQMLERAEPQIERLMTMLGPGLERTPQALAAAADGEATTAMADR
jgi:hypothetical protein